MNIDFKDMVMTIVTGIITFLAAYWALKSSKGERTAQFISQNRIEWLKVFREYISDFYCLLNKNIQDSESIEEMARLTIKTKLHLNYSNKIDREIITYMDNIIVMNEKLIYYNEKRFFNNRNIIKENIEELYKMYRSTNIDEIKRITGKTVEEIKELKVSELTDIQKDELIKFIEGDGKSIINNYYDRGKVLVVLVQIYLKCEWDRIKYEVKSGKEDGFDYLERYKKLRESKKAELAELGYKYSDYESIP